MKKYFAAFIVAALLPSCGPTNVQSTSPAPPSWDSVQSLSYGSVPSWTPTLKRIAIENESRFLKDPYSAKFEYVGAKRFVRFSTATQTFESGYAVKPMLAASTDADGFAASGMEKFANTLRNLRNALVHSRESRMADVIAPSPRNHRLLKSFIGPLSAIAHQLVFTIDAS